MHPASLCQLCATAMAYAVELMARGVIWMSAHWPSSLFVLAVTFSLCLCQNYPLCWVLALVSQGRVTLRHLLAGWHQVWCVKYWNKPQRDLDARSEASLQLLCPFALPFSLITYKFRRAKLDFCISFYPREVEPYSTFILPFYNISS